MLKAIFKWFGTGAAILVVVLVALYSLYVTSPQKSYYITFGGELIFIDERKSTWLIDNREESNEKMLRIYWAGNGGQGNVSQQVVKSSELVDSSGKKLDSNNIKFNGVPVLATSFTHGWNEIGVTLNNYSLLPGSFQGSILVNGNTSDSIPLTISTKTLLLYSIMLVIVGALISVCIWEVIRYYRTKAKYPENTKLQGLLGTPNVVDAHIKAQMTINEIELAREFIRNSNPGVTLPKLAIMEVFTTLLGIAFALFGILYNENVTGVYELGWYQVATLLGIGLATGSLKELVEKV